MFRISIFFAQGHLPYTPATLRSRRTQGCAQTIAGERTVLRVKAKAVKVKTPRAREDKGKKVAAVEKSETFGAQEHEYPAHIATPYFHRKG